MLWNKKNKDKILTIFLDIDGVLNTTADWKRSSFPINDSCVKEFVKAVNQYRKIYKDVEVVLSSTWRVGNSDKIKKVLDRYGIKLAGSTPIASKSRWEEIEYYRKRHGIVDYIIIDDDPSLFEGCPHPENIHFTKSEIGFLERDL